MTAMGNNGLSTPLIDCWNTLDIGSDEGLEVMTLAGDAPGGYLPPWLSGLSSCVCVVMIKDSRVYAYYLMFVTRRSFGVFLYIGVYEGCYGCGR